MFCKLISQKTITSIIIAASLTTLTGCASIVSGQHQAVSVNTAPVKEAKCSLENSKGKWYVSNAPGSVMVNRSYSDMRVTCEKNGYKKTEKTVASSTKPLVFGNVLFGGPIGAGVDIADGAAYDYPQEIRIPLEKA
ncbi:MAG: hypothetical protein EPO11_10500 [Gammaproteobacteria bacterium]|nr:MAG: hypothetical protein EPO11_10500 [Gammaproteobacteria bacterium]